MKLVKQQGNECMLAAIAIYHEYDLKSYRKEPLSREWMRHLDEELDEFQPQTDVSATLMSKLLTTAGFPPLTKGKNRFDEPDYKDGEIDGRSLKGKGLLIFDHDNGCHAVAFEDYTIYDSNYSTPYYFAELGERYPPVGGYLVRKEHG